MAFGILLLFAEIVRGVQLSSKPWQVGTEKSPPTNTARTVLPPINEPNLDSPQLDSSGRLAFVWPREGHRFRTFTFRN